MASAGFQYAGVAYQYYCEGCTYVMGKRAFKIGKKINFQS